MTSSEIREKFLSFFKGKNHTIVPSAPMVIKDDPTLMFTNAGMNQFKEYFLGNSISKHPRIADTQKCLRVSGKHNDLEEVGKDTYHHTMFEMLGNWSFGDYFKKEAIAWAWELLTEVYKIDKESLYVSVFEGSEDDNLTLDQEAYDLWKAIVPENRIILGSKKDNFWEMGDQGPCGPCSEIHVDIRPASEKAKVAGASLVNQDHPEVIEIWNLVFIQYNRKADGSLEPLPEKHVDTGMGFERLSMVLQGVNSSYDSDIFRPILKEVESITGEAYGSDPEKDIAMRVVADHIRAVAFSIADGQLPSNNGAGYVIRRILRRAVRYGFTFLGTHEPFLFKLVKVLVTQMGTAFPELKRQSALIENVVREEEHSFLKTLEQGLVLLDEVISGTKGKVVDGQKAFELYDTFGFPIDLTSLILGEKGYTLDTEGFEKAMQEQKSRSRSASEVAKDDWQVVHTNGEQEFLGYDQLEAEVRLVKYRKITTKKDKTQFQLVFDKTPFYPEGGGQVGDMGYLEVPNGDVVYILDTKKENNEIVHYAKNLPKHLNESLTAVVNKVARANTERNHSATHLLHQALRNVLGSHVEQKGSAVHPGHLRFDFSHFAKLTNEELTRVEDFVNERIHEHLPLQENRQVSMKEAMKEGAIALFGEKYGDQVRTIRFGNSIELCGGTHVKNTAEIWHFKIVSEGAIAAGVRRIEAITSDAVLNHYEEKEGQLDEIKARLKSSGDPVKAIEGLIEENAQLKKEIEALQKDKAKGLKAEIKKELEQREDYKFLSREVDLDAGAMKDLSFEMGQEVDNLFLLLGSEKDGKALLSCYISKDLANAKGWNAGQIVRELGKFIQGGGGGQPFFATAGGKNPEGIKEALEKVRSLLT
ncbi:alanyl-tRNA synthetase [Muriicola jejuensis]|uniref:Alanine--tRNA ligase n=1 Tax=Muriicola jejuensis TaxID=504488 RepID=A0A6P0UIK8_9FLAO|nr:alanine--tRNA ligase [Muriicola jejuensis]NER11718.1 alanine--tRNA ligase [Muriicola jejuensis]SMP25177.1 alanyl-tRNA synthetase [Muriicola jejuensis]